MLTDKMKISDDILLCKKKTQKHNSKSKTKYMLYQTVSTVNFTPIIKYKTNFDRKMKLIQVFYLGHSK
jgi:hypothetical protein